MAFRVFRGDDVNMKEGWARVAVPGLGECWARIVMPDEEYRQLVDEWKLEILGWGAHGRVWSDLSPDAKRTLEQARRSVDGWNKGKVAS